MTALRCDVCGADARFICTICRRPFCTGNGCPQNDSIHPSVEIPPTLVNEDGPVTAKEPT